MHFNIIMQSKCEQYFSWCLSALIVNFLLVQKFIKYIYIYYYIYIRLKIKPNSVRIRFQSCQIFVLPSAEFDPTPLIHCSTIRLALRPAPQTTLPHIYIIFMYGTAFAIPFKRIIGTVMVVNVWQLHVQLPVQSVAMTTEVASSNLAHGEVYSIYIYVIQFVTDLRQICETDRHDITKILLKVALNPNP